MLCYNVILCYVNAIISAGPLLHGSLFYVFYYSSNKKETICLQET